MGRTYNDIDPLLASWIVAQPLFFVATAPLSGDGLVNCSPKGNRDELVVLDGGTVAYLDQTGSGAETIAHLRENGRIVLMFTAFSGKPRIVRLHGRGRVVLPEDEAFPALAARFPRASGPGVRSVIVTDVARIADSCGYGVPLMSFESHRTTLDEWAERKGADGVAAYRAEQNAHSLDGLPALAARHGRTAS